MVTLRQYGKKKQSLLRPSLSTGVFSDLGRLTPVDGIEMVRSRDAGSIVEMPALDGENVVVEIELENGLRIWQSAESAVSDFAGFRTPEERANGITLPQYIGMGSRQRGVLGLALKSLKALKIDPMSDLARLSALEIARKLEDRLKPGPGLYMCSALKNLGKKLNGEAADTAKAKLLLIHGTMSSTDGGFSGLETAQNGKVWRDLQTHYGEGGILAFEHRTLTVSPIVNALELARALPSGVKLHILTHSRGGLVGELMARAMRSDGKAPFDSDDTGIFEKADAAGNAYDEDVRQLKELSTLLKTKKIEVELLVRVACPVRGTTLASRRLDRYLSLLVNIMELIPGLAENPVFDLVSTFLVAVARQRTDPAVIPGLAAQMPDSPLVRMLNRPDVEVGGKLAVISGDIEGAGILQRLLVFATDLFYTDDHDLVVNTAAMEGGAQRRQSAVLFDQSGDVSHFHYFSNRRTANAMLGALSGGELERVGFRAEATRAEPRGLPRGKSEKLPALVFIPAFMGSTLHADGELLWPNLGSLSREGLAAIAPMRPRIVAGEPIHEIYGALLEHLSASHRIVSFGYDWRKSVKEEGERLAAFLSSEFKRNGPALRVLAHGSGELLLRFALIQDSDLRRSLTSTQSNRAIVIAPPQTGSRAMTATLLGRGELARTLLALCPSDQQQAALDILAAMPGLLEQMHVQDLNEERWRQFADAQAGSCGVPTASALAAARDTLAMLDKPLPLKGFLIRVLEQENALPADIVVDLAASGRDKIRLVGDSQDVQNSARVTNGFSAAIWHSSSEHGALIRDSANFKPIQELLSYGQTTGLVRDRPQARGQAIDGQYDRPLSQFPNAQDLLDAAMAMPAKRKSRPDVEKIGVSIIHGSLAFTQHPVLVGHYVGDMLIGVEAYIDGILDHRLSRRRDFGLYPGAVGTNEVFLSSSSSQLEVIVVGLGRYGSLYSSSLTETISGAVLRYALLKLEEDRGASKVTELKLASLIIGHRESRLTVRDSVFALLEGVTSANRVLAAQETHGGKARVVELEFIELYENTAIEAAAALREAMEHPRYRGLLVAEPAIKRGRGGKARVEYGREPGWWQRVEITAGDSGEPSKPLSFVLHSDSAQADRIIDSSQRKLVDKLIDSAETAAGRETDLNSMLYELLIPQELKNYALDRRNMILVLDEEAARYPWELLQDRLNRDERPAAVRSSIIRQLIGDHSSQIRSYATGNTALVIGDPPSNLPPLPEAAKEALEVAGQLETSGFKVESCIEKPAVECISALMLGNYKVLHLAGHGNYEKDDKGDVKAAGMVLGDDIFLTPAEVAKLRPMPEFVFINCCHLGKVEPMLDSRLLAANLGAQFIRQGVKAVIMAGWAVDDAAAKCFAKTFYDAMIAGNNFGEAVLAARRETYDLHRATNTWGAYQCYGDPGYSFYGPSRSDTVNQRPQFYAPLQVIAAARNIMAESEFANRARNAALRQELDALEQDIPEQWRSDAAVVTAIGLAHGELARLERAISCLEAALGCSNADVPLVAVEQLANFRVRHAVNCLNLETSSPKPEFRRKAKQCIQNAIADLKGLPRSSNSASYSAERDILIGASFKRLAQLQSGKARIASLNHMSSHYGSAFNLLLRDPQNSDTLYPALNWLSPRILAWYLGQDDATLARDIASLENLRLQALQRHERTPAFWNAIVMPESKLLDGLWSCDLSARTKEIVEDYKSARKRGCSLKQLLSVTENHRFFCLALADRSKTPRYAERQKSLRDMKELAAKVAAVLQDD